MINEQTFDIDDRIEYLRCNPGDPRGTLYVDLGKVQSNCRMIHWDNSIRGRTEVDCLQELKKYLTRFRK